MGTVSGDRAAEIKKGAGYSTYRCRRLTTALNASKRAPAPVVQALRLTSLAFRREVVIFEQQDLKAGASIFLKTAKIRFLNHHLYTT
jgi:hypothetical protein